MSDSPNRELTLRDYAHVVSRRRWVLVVAVAGTLASALSLSALQEPIYEAEAQMLVNTGPVETIFDQAGGSSRDPVRAIETEIKVLESGLVAERVRLDLALEQS